MKKSDLNIILDRIRDLSNMLEEKHEDFSLYFDELRSLCDQVMEAYSISNSREHLKILEGLTKTSNEQVCENLAIAREAYLLSSPRSYLDLLNESLQSEVSFDELLSEMGLVHHCYIEFIYSKIWSKSKGTAAQVLNELSLTKKHYESLNDLGVLFFSEKPETDKLRISKLKELGYQFIDRYLQYIRCEIREEGVMIKTIENEGKRCK